MLIIFFDIRGIVHKEFVLAGQTVTFAYYYDVLQRLHENVQRLCPKLQQQKNWHHYSSPSPASVFTREFFAKNNHDSCPPPPTHHTFLFPKLKIKLKGCHFDTIEVIEAESQAVLNTLTERYFQH
jgi:hypothetical protein